MGNKAHLTWYIFGIQMHSLSFDYITLSIDIFQYPNGCHDNSQIVNMVVNLISGWVIVYIK